MSVNAREAILAEAKHAAQKHGYNGINFRSIASAVGIKNASIYYHFDSKASLGAAVAHRYWQDTAQHLETIRSTSASAGEALKRYPAIFRQSLEDDNRLCLSSFMAAEYEDLPHDVKVEVQAFVDANVAWLNQVLSEKGTGSSEDYKKQALAIYTAVAGAQLIARIHKNTELFDELMVTYQQTGLIPII
ncbi:TetR/AcrR family transcriptional regulator (plasmid) [Rahnella aquatilis]|uniref:TetR/AcrR family transcriptional regulator n=1 Tax=Rahnella perminowiae TaxID=2816244 RepID=A0ABS6KZW6_9GAMM|nr:TetR/AcrR family transcriptional regulator [Rahnella perminowiae]MBU9834630.1 TetR/AcrR family transcriptional regulator [Rahnella perminowiae]UJD92656.1 TetR/AcrR family transcriptional regulator [Rahnella aquatilis]